MPMESVRKLLVLLLFSCFAATFSYAVQPQPVRATHAMVVSVHALASQAGVDIMKQGGNAVDAAVAVGFALAVVHPQAGNLAVADSCSFAAPMTTSTFSTIREKAPAAATARDVSRMSRKSDSRPQHRRLQSHRRSRICCRARLRAETLGKTDVGEGDGPGDQAGPRRISARGE